MSGPALLANLGGEEGGEAPLRSAAARATVEALWRDLFVEPALLPVLASVEAAAWWNSPEAERWASDLGLRLFGPRSDVAARVHDKAFTWERAREEGLLPAPFDRGVVHAPEDVAAGSAFIESLRRALDAPPPGAIGFTLKPRFGSSGRGRVALALGEDPEPRVAGARARLAARGGAILEPWVERIADYSTQLQVGAEGVTLLATLEQITTASGLVTGHRGQVDSRGRVTCGAACDEALREAALPLALSLADAGFEGVCGVDAFVFRTPEGERLRPLVECNARFTVGLLAMAQVRRALPALRERLGLAPGTLRAFAFRLAEPDEGWPSDTETRFVRRGPGGSGLVLGTDVEQLGDL